MSPPVRTCDKDGCACNTSIFSECEEGNPYLTVEPITPQPKNYKELKKLGDAIKPGFRVCCMMANRERPAFGQYRINPDTSKSPAPPSNKDNPLEPPEEPELDKDKATLAVGGALALVALIAGGGAVAYLVSRKKSDTPPPPDPELENSGRPAILPPEFVATSPPAGHAVPPPLPAVQQPAAPVQPAEPPRAVTPVPAVPEWDRGVLRDLLAQWQRSFDALPEAEKPRYVDRWNYEALANQYFVKGDIVPAYGFTLGQPAPHTNELVAADFGSDPRAYAVLAEARQIGERNRNAGKSEKETVTEISNLIERTYAGGKGGNIDPIRTGVFEASPTFKGHRFILLQTALQEAGLKSRFVMGQMAGAGFNTWVEVDVDRNGTYSYVIDYNREKSGRKLNPASTKGHVKFGDAELFAIENDMVGGTYVADANTFNVVWRRKTPERMAAELEPAFKMLCEKLSIMPENAHLGDNPAGRSELARRAAMHLIDWNSKTAAERQAIIDGLPSGARERFDQQKSGAAAFAQKSGMAGLEEFVMPETWIAKQEELARHRPASTSWDSHKLTAALGEWERAFDALPPDQKRDAIQPWNYEELENQDLKQDDFVIGHEFVLGDPSTYDRELLPLNFRPDSKTYPMLEGARRIAKDIGVGSDGKVSVASRHLVADKIADLIDENFASSQGFGIVAPGDAHTLGHFFENGGCCRHRSALLQMALQEAGVPSRYVRGKAAGGGWHAWVEADVKGDGSFSYMIDLNNRQRGFKGGQTDLGGGEVMIEMIGGKGFYIVKPDKHNKVWRRRSAAEIAKILEPRFKALCEQLAAMPGNADQRSDAVWRGEISRRAASYLVSRLLSSPAEEAAALSQQPAPAAPSEPEPAPELPKTDPPAAREPAKESRSWLDFATDLFRDFLKGRGRDRFLADAMLSDNVPDDYPFRIDHSYSAPETKHGMDLQGTMDVLAIQRQLKAYTSVTRHLDADEQIALARHLAEGAHAALVKEGEIPRQVIEAVCATHGVPGTSIGSIVIGATTPTELDALLARRVQSVMAQLKGVKSWHREQDGNVEDLGDWYGKQNSATQEFLARVVVFGGLKPRHFGAVRFGRLDAAGVSRILAERGFTAEPDTDGLQLYNYELPEQFEGMDMDFTNSPGKEMYDSADHRLNEVRLQMEERIDRVATQLKVVPGLSDDNVRMNVAGDIVLDALFMPPKDGIVQKQVVAEAMRKRGIAPTVVENVSLYPGVGAEEFNLHVEHQIIMGQMEGMPEFEHLTPEELSEEAVKLVIKWHALSSSDKLVMERDPGMRKSEVELVPRNWLRAERLASAARELRSQYGTDLSPALDPIHRNREGIEKLDGLWRGLTPAERAVFKGGYAEFQLRMVAQHNYPLETYRTGGVFDQWREERFERTRREGRFEEMLRIR